MENSRLETFSMVIASFLVDAKNKKLRFFEETFLLANISIEVTLEMFFFTLSNIEINFINQELRWRSYTIIKVFFITKWVELIRKKKFQLQLFIQIMRLS